MDEASERSAGPSDETLTDAIRRLSRASVMVVGDVMLDRYIYGNVSRISPEAPVPVLRIEREVALPGGAGNVVRNLTALGAAVALVSVVGDDQAGSDLTGLIGGQPNVEPWLLVEGARCTTLKTRHVAAGQQLLRTDREETSAIQPKLAERLLRIARDALAATSVTVLSDYRKGVLAREMPARIMAEAKAAGRPVVVDPQGPDFARYAGADLITPTFGELAAATQLGSSDTRDIIAAAGRLRVLHRFGAVLVQCGEAGLMLVDAEGSVSFPLPPGPVFDASGAGDTVVATVAAALAAGLELRLAAAVAALAAGIVMGQPGMAVARDVDLLAALTREGRAVRKIVSRDIAAEQVERWRRLGWRTGFLDSALLGPDGREAAIAKARAACDRLVVGVPAHAERHEDGAEATRAADFASNGPVDLVCVYDEESVAETLRTLRPDLVLSETG